MAERRKRTRYDSPENSTDDQIRLLKQQVCDKDANLRHQDAQLREQDADLHHQANKIGNFKHEKK